MYSRTENLVRGFRKKVIAESDDKEEEDVNVDADYIVDEKAKTATLTARGVKKAEEYFGLENLSDPENSTIAHHINQAIKAHGTMKRDIDYVIKDGQVVIVDEFTGRLMAGRRFSDGLHQALEAKEHVTVAAENQTLASITFQNYFRMYDKLSGMTGTADTEAVEFAQIYGLEVSTIPPNRPMVRKDMPDLIYRTRREKMQAIIQACVEASSPVILQVSSGARKYANQTLLRYMAQGAVEYAKELGKNIPIVLHLDHGNSFELCKSCIDMGFSSVMIDGSHLPYEENVALTKQVVDYAHQFDVTVEGELGVLAGVEDEVSAEHHTYTRPEEVVDFVSKTGVDSLAISIGTSHGANKFKPEQCTRNAEGILVPPELRFDILAEIEKELPGFPIVLHGSSSVPQEYVKIINTHGGKLKDAVGIPEEQLRKAAKTEKKNS